VTFLTVPMIDYHKKKNYFELGTKSLNTKFHSEALIFRMPESVKTHK
jgi:hypothetical protein